jgi:ribonucleoside-diphosphate reductase alpha chain
VYRTAYEKGCKGCTTYRPNPVTGAVLAADEERAERAAHPCSAHLSATPAIAAARTALALAPRAAERAEGGDVVYMTKPLDRPGESARSHLQGALARSRSRVLHHDQRHRAGRAQRPFEIFINSKNMEHYAWTVALTRMISAVFRRGGDVSFVVEELKAVFDPRGGQWMGGRYIPSLLAAIGR